MDKKDFKWGNTEEAAFNNIKRTMTSLPCLKNIDYKSSDPLWLITDASGSGLGAALFQGREWKKVSPIAYESHLMTPTEKNYLRNLSRFQALWTEFLADFDLQFNYIKGEENSVANALLRKNLGDESEQITNNSVACVAALSMSTASISPALRSKIVAGYLLDPWCQALQQVLDLRDDCLNINGLIIIEGPLLVPNTDWSSQECSQKWSGSMELPGGPSTWAQPHPPMNTIPCQAILKKSFPISNCLSPQNNFKNHPPTLVGNRTPLVREGTSTVTLSGHFLSTTFGHLTPSLPPAQSPGKQGRAIRPIRTQGMA
ncbi:hypothetical protein PCANC_05867 [Puccinia coronata f. sp. avenae]|uniref:Reverse transcriptase/retrotransposon-derived protein RNase H-like domain-containing protein n=1 Tax=Puccinia coronata f. sp. avenae TaxID=200324 RepID=A0A2N5VBL6_9BASI|nr:hypothetical protein PCANC_05867 [Puccinia coronata f. sp. avenae]